MLESAIARALAVTPLPGESPREALRRYLAGKRLLLAIDNFEHVLEAAELLAELHGRVPGIDAAGHEPRDPQPRG